MSIGLPRFKKEALSILDAGIPVITKMVFTLGTIKLISITSDPGGLAKWGVVQNLVALFSSMLGLSIHSGIASAKVSGKDPIALERGIFLLLLTTVFIVFTHQILLWLDFEVLPKYGLSGATLIVMGIFGALFNYFYAYIPVVTKLTYLTLMNFIFGVTTISVLYLYGLGTLDAQAAAITSGNILAVGVIFFMLRSQLFKIVSLHEIIDIKKNKYLIAFGFASFVNAVVSSALALFIRSGVIETGGQGAGDIFEAGLRIVALVETSLGAVVGLLIWRFVGKGGQATISSLMPFFQFSFFGIVAITAIFLILGDFLIGLLFTSDYKFNNAMYVSVLYMAAVKILISIAILPYSWQERSSGLLFLNCFS